MQLSELRANDLAHGRTVEVTTRGASVFRVRKARTQHPNRRVVAEHPIAFYPTGKRYYPSIDALRRDLAGR